MNWSERCGQRWVSPKRSDTGHKSSEPWRIRHDGENATRGRKIKLTLMGAYPTSPRAAFLEWCQAHAPVFTANATNIGLTTAQATAF